MSSLFAGGPAEPVCSRSGCMAPAAWRIDWRNPAIHSADRTKTWLACPEHRDHLSGFLESRGFPIRVVSFEDVRGRA